MKRKIVLLLLVLLAPVLSYANHYVFFFFTDVGIENPHFKAIQYARRDELIEGYSDGTYQPDKLISRIEFLKILLEATDKTQYDCEFDDLPFSDLHSSEDPYHKPWWYIDYIKSGLCHDIIQGYPDGTFRQDALINYAEASKIISESYQLPEPEDMSCPYEGDCLWYTKYINQILASNAKPRSNILPEDKVTRGEVAEMIYLVDTNGPYFFRNHSYKGNLKLIGRASVIESPYPYSEDDSLVYEEISFEVESSVPDLKKNITVTLGCYKDHQLAYHNKDTLHTMHKYDMPYESNDFLLFLNKADTQKLLEGNLSDGRSVIHVYSRPPEDGDFEGEIVTCTNKFDTIELIE